MFPSMIRRAASSKPPFNVYTNPYKAKRLWPPDFSKLSPKHQFRLERRYRRRAKLKWARPQWTKFVKITQLSLILFTAVYGVLFLDWGRPEGEAVPFKGIRSWFDRVTSSFWTRPERGAQKNVDDASPVAGA